MTSKKKEEADLLGGGNEESTSQQTHPDLETLRKKRKTLRAKITRTVNRLSAKMEDGTLSKSRLDKELVVLRKEFLDSCSVNSEMFLVPDIDVQRLQEWEETVSDVFYDFEEAIESYANTLTTSSDAVSRTTKVKSQDAELDEKEHTAAVNPATCPTLNAEATDFSPFAYSGFANTNTNCNIDSFDSWIDNLIEFQETVLSANANCMSIADALYRLEASRDVPTLKLSEFNGSPLEYVDFIDCFKIHIHNKPFLTDDLRMAQLKMHLTGEAARVILSLGSGGMMYATALKMLKDQFGQKSAVARACLNKLTKGTKINRNDRKGLRDLSVDVMNSLATLHRLKFFADANASETLRQVIKRLPDQMIFHWKGVATDIRERGELPSLSHISDFLRKRVKSDYDPDFGDLCSENKSEGRFPFVAKELRKGVHAAQEKRPLKCFVCEMSHRVSECPTMIDSTVMQRLKLVKDHQLCFGCLYRGHISRECRSKKKCDKGDCSRMHHPLLHTDPPTASSVTSPALDLDGILPVIRVTFNSRNGRAREGNVLLDSGAGTTIIRGAFARALGLQGKRESLELSVVGGEKYNKSDSRRLKFWISAINGTEEHEIEAHEIDKTVMSVLHLDRKWLSSFTHLSDLTFAHKAGPIDLILGVQYSHLHAEEEVRQGLPFEPIGKRTRLGWCVMGPGNTDSSSISVNSVLKPDLSQMYDLETIGVQAPNCECSGKILSLNGQKAMDSFEQTCEKKGDRYVIGLPWEKDPKGLPNNRTLVEKRLVSLERSLSEQPEKASLYKKAINEYFENDGQLK